MGTWWPLPVQWMGKVQTLDLGGLGFLSWLRCVLVCGHWNAHSIPLVWAFPSAREAVKASPLGDDGR